jgi:hypothetical protein
VQRVRLNNANLPRTWVDWSSVAHGGRLAHTLGSSPSAWGTGKAAQPPSVNRTTLDRRTHLDASLRPSRAVVPTGTTAQQSRFDVDLLAQTPGAIVVTLKAKAPKGWRVSVAPGKPRLLVSRGLPVATSATVTVTMPAGTPVGSYPVSLKVSGRGADTVTRNATVDVRVPPACVAGAADQCAVDLAAERNADGTAAVDESGDASFDGVGWSFDAALFPPAGPVTFAGVTYLAPDPAGTAANLVQANGQALLLPAGRRSALKVVATAHNGPVSTQLTVSYADGTTAQLPITVADWCATAADGSSTVLAMPHRVKVGTGEDGPAVSLFGFDLPLDPTKEIRSVGLPDDPRVHLYAITLG